MAVSAGARARIAAQQVGDLRRDGDIQLLPVVDHAGGGAADPVAEMIRPRYRRANRSWRMNSVRPHHA